ncbi:MAG TPA: zinc ribbon domain-containing protein [Solirubrobacteraceae bacterium]
MRKRVDRAARGSDVPAGIDRDDTAASTGSRERGRMRRRLRELRRLREAQLIELGALVLEAHRHGRDDSPVVKRKASEAAAIDEEARAIEQALETDAGLDTVVATGVAGPCPTCGTLTSTSARFCSTCGTALDGRPDAAPRGATAPSAPPAGPDPDAPASADPDIPAEPATTEIPAANGDGTTPEEAELEPTGGGDR